MAKENILIYAPVPLYETDNGFSLEDQACNGLRLWAESFDTVSVMMPVMTGTVPSGWVPISTVGKNLERINIVPLPTAYRPDQFFRHFSSTKRLIRNEIEKANYLSFSIGGFFGDWGAVSCYQAHRMGRTYAVWTDRVESEVTRKTAHVGSWRKRLRAHLTYRPMFMLEKYLIQRSTLGLFHGKETYDTYEPHCRQPHIVHDIHIHRSEHISTQALELKKTSADSGALKIVYVGRVDAMKGPLEWFEVIGNLAAAGVNFEASWFGEGPDLDAMRKKVAAAGLQDRLKFPGFTNDRHQVLELLRAAHIFLFCHKTPESPRCLIEALVSGTPIVGYDCAFAADLISHAGGGILSKLGDTQKLTKNIINLDLDRKKLAKLFHEAANAGSVYDDESVFKHRSDLIHQYL
jgi:colanic acid/amylovoran biosynthesis glycosyltransferase